MSKTVIIGGGASGLIAAAQSAEAGNDVTIVEKMPRVGRKLMITGKGRCNVTNACFDLNELISNVTTNGKFLYRAFSAFMPYDTMDLIENLGVPLKTERGNRVFPKSDKASDIVDALRKNAVDKGVKIINETAKAFEFDGDMISALILESKKKIYADSFALCTGGKSYPATGSTGDGYILARSAGHRITDLKASLVPLVSDNNFVSDLQGLSLKNVKINVVSDGKSIYNDFGEMIFTHFGVSGPIILSASAHIKDFNKKTTLTIDLKPALDEKKLDNRIVRDFNENPNKDFINSLSKLLPNKLIPVIVKLSGIEPSAKVNQITKPQRAKLVHLLKNFTLNITGTRPIEEAIVTSGGVDVKEINPATMQSKLVKNLYFAGEIIDVDAYTGGFNLQIAFSTGYLCGKNLQ